MNPDPKNLASMLHLQDPKPNILDYATSLIEAFAEQDGQNPNTKEITITVTYSDGTAAEGHPTPFRGEESR